MPLVDLNLIQIGKLVVLDSREDGFQRNLLDGSGVYGGFRTIDSTIEEVNTIP
jgi:hypothetical protein